MLKALRGLIDLYIPDLKYFKDDHALKYSGVTDYFRIASAAVAEMYSQTGAFVIAGSGMMKRGVIIRHLCLPGLTLDSKLILKHIQKTYGDQVYVSIMNQYTPMHRAKDYPEISGRLPQSQYRSILSYAQSLGLTNCLVQDSASQSEAFTPVFDLTGV
jgi:putative pyruvate formate lyase activating enzyme